ncbi:MAG: NAD(P)H-dependent oxidoreductase [Phycisphaeraceae bacterium]|nr:NAD(P)H-dependent oxidoreductase [Phycisphaeraceae bacterium]
MSSEPRILAFAGSNRAESYNRKMLRVAVDAAKKAGASVTHIELRDYPLPIMDEDLESSQGIPENALKLKKLQIDHAGFLIATPEYNGSVPPLLKNTIDWVSRPVKGEPPLAAFQGKIVALMGASPGAFGGARSLIHLRAILAHMGSVVLPDQVTIPNASEIFAEDGSVKDPRQQARIEAVPKKLVEFMRRLGH